MAKYHASPRYKVGDITFDMNGNYSTDVAKEITALDALVPTWIRRVDDAPISDKSEEPVAQEDAIPQKPAPKPRKASGK